MLGVQNNVSVSNQLRFRGEEATARGPRPMNERERAYYDICERQERELRENPPEYEPTQEDLDAERDEKLAKINGAKQECDKFAESLEAAPNESFKKFGKVVRVGSMLAGLAGTFVVAKYGSKGTINAFRNFTKSNSIQNLLKNGKDLLEKTKKPASEVSEYVSTKLSKPVSNYLKGTKLGKAALAFLQKPIIKSTLEKAEGYKEAGKTLLKAINGDKIQTWTENTLAASATASVLIDDLAGRNDNKSNLDVALGASGGDK